MFFFWGGAGLEIKHSESFHAGLNRKLAFELDSIYEYILTH